MLLATRSLRPSLNRAVASAGMTFPDLTVGAGEVVAIVGPSRSGKSTLMSMIAGLIEPASGTVERNPPDVAAWGSLTFVPQSLLLVPELSVFENIALGAGRLLPPPDTDLNESVASAAEAVDVARLLHRRIDELSVGERQRVMVARAVVARPQLLVADEPAAHQDQEHATSVLQLLTSTTKQGGACVLFTRNETISAGADQVLRLEPLAG
jgi:ABC-type lipoprotein export system ATPase subunit